MGCKKAIKALEEVREEIKKELKDYSFAFQLDEINIIEDHIKIIDDKIKELER